MGGSSAGENVDKRQVLTRSEVDSGSDYGYGREVLTLNKADSVSDYGYGSELLTLNEADSASDYGYGIDWPTLADANNTSVGKGTRTDEHLVFDDMVHRCRTVQRRTNARRWNKDLVEQVDALPWMPKPPRVEALEPSFRRKYITWAHVTKFGGSPGCTACSVDGPAHSKACRERFEKIFADEAEQHATKVAMESASRKAALSSEAALAPSAPMAEPMLVENERIKPQDHEDASMTAPRLGTGPVAGTAADAPMPMTSSSSSSERDPKRLRTIAGLPIFAVEMCGRNYELDQPILEGVQDGEHDAIEMHVGFDDEELIEKPAGPVQVPLPTKAIYGTRSGEPLDPVKVAAGRQREMDSIYRHDVKEDVLNSEEEFT